MTLQTCNDAFAAARAERLKHPLNEGLFKLDAALRDIEDWQKLVATISGRVRAGDKFDADECLGPCMAHERGAYLKGLPARLAWLIGYMILPGIAALGGDGVPKAEVQSLVRRAEADAQRLLADCESVRCRLKLGIDTEYRAMRRSGSLLLDLLDAAADLAQLRPVPAQV